MNRNQLEEMRQWLIRGSMLAVLFVAFAAQCFAEGEAPYDLRVEGLENSMVIDREIPAFSWKMKDERRGATQSAYQILVASSPEKLVGGRADLWDSGKVKSNQSIYVNYAGKKLVSDQKAYWAVRIWNEKGEESPFSQSTWFRMSLLNPEKEWTAKWIQSPDTPLENKLTDLWTTMALIPQKVKGLNEYNREQMATLRPSPLLRREFTLPAKPVRAVLRSCNLGYGENRINGQKVGDGFFEPATTYYPIYSLFNTYDVTSMLKQGKNALGIMLGDGWFCEPLAWSTPKTVFGHPMASAQLFVELENGTTITLITDDSWKTAPGPILKNHYYIGECYDARALPVGWDSPNFDDSNWKSVLTVASPTKKLQPQKVETEKIVRRVKPVSVNSPAPGIYVFDMGEMLVGFPEINVPASQTNPVIVRCAEWAMDVEYNGRVYRDLYKDVDDREYKFATPLYYENIPNPMSIKGMIANKPRGGGFYGRGFRGTDGASAVKWNMAPPTMVYQGNGEAAKWHPRFAVVPFRYIEVQGLKQPPKLDFIAGCVVHTATPTTGTFSSSEKVYEDIHEAALHSSLYCMHNMTWDNPCERAQQPMQHSENYSLMAMTVGVGPFTKKLIEDFDKVRNKNGETAYIPYTRRTNPNSSGSNAPKQVSPDINLPWQYYLYYGDKRVLEEHFASMEKCIKGLIDDTDKDSKKGNYKYLRTGGYEFHQHGLMVLDGEPGIEVDRFAYSSAWFYQLARRTAVVAGIIGKADKAAEYNTLADNIRAEYHKTWPTTINKGYGGLVDKKTKKVDVSMGNLVLSPLAIITGVAPDEDWKAIADNMAKVWTEKYDHHPDCGPQEVAKNLRALSDYGYVDLAADWMRSTKHPSYGYMLSFGTKTVWEGFADPTDASVNSTVQNEFQTGANWLQESLCGVNTDINGPGMKHFFLDPKIPVKVESAGTEFESPYGKIKSSWKQKDGIVTWDVRVPANSSATLTFPCTGKLADIEESGKPIAKAAGLKTIAGSASSILVSSGSYQFRFKRK